MIHIKEFPTMYCRDKRGKIRVFILNVYEIEGNVGLITSETGGFKNKKVAKSKKVSRGKNFGKSNETTPVEQAVSEAESMFLKKKDEGYKTVNDLLVKTGFDDRSNMLADTQLEVFLDQNLPVFNTDANGRIKPMLAQKFTKNKKKVKYPCLVQPKYNGVRCLAFIENNDVVLLSRGGKEYDVTHVKDALRIIFIKEMIDGNRNIILDGELYVHKLPLQDLVHKVKSYTLFDTEITYVVYDTFDPENPNLNQQARWEKLGQLPFYDETKNNKPVCKSITYLCGSEESIYDYHKKNIKAGYEGSIVRLNKATYRPGFRDFSLLKIKDSISEEYTITGVYCSPDSPYEDFVWKCITAEGEEFEVKPHGTVEERRNLYKNSYNYIGKKLQLSFFEKTNKGIPFHINSVVIRDYE